MFVDDKSLVLKLNGRPATRDEVYRNAVEATTRRCLRILSGVAHHDLKELIRNGELPPFDKMPGGSEEEEEKMRQFVRFLNLDMHLRMRRGSTCYYCGTTTFGPNKLERDHVVPRARGGSDSEKNIVKACRPCNQRKSAQIVEEFRESTKKRYRAEKAPLFFGELPEVRKALRISTQTKKATPPDR